MSRRTSIGMPVSSADESARQLAQATRQLVSVITEQTKVARAALPQFFGATELRRRWNCGEERLAALLQMHAGITTARGHRINVSLDDVLKVDEALTREYEVRKVITRRRVDFTAMGAAHAS